MGQQVNLRMALNELFESGEKIIGCGFADKNGLTLVRVGDITSKDIAFGVHCWAEGHAAKLVTLDKPAIVENYKANQSLVINGILKDTSGDKSGNKSGTATLGPSCFPSLLYLVQINQETEKSSDFKEY